MVDADGRPAPNCLYVCTAGHLFGDPAVGAVQIDVRMSNRDSAPRTGNRLRRWFGATLVRMQDMEFRTAIAAIQLSRGYTERSPWAATGSSPGSPHSTPSPVRSSDPGVARCRGLRTGCPPADAGWRTGFSIDTHVDQEGLAEMATKVEAAHLMMVNAAQLKDSGERNDVEAGLAKLLASEYCAEVTNEFLLIGEGTSEIQKTIISWTYYRISRKVLRTVRLTLCRHGGVANDDGPGAQYALGEIARAADDFYDNENGPAQLARVLDATR